MQFVNVESLLVKNMFSLVNRTKVKQFLLVPIAMGLAFTVASCRIEQESPGEAPEVNVEPGELPEYDVEGPDVDITTEEQPITVPEVNIEQREETIEVPQIDIEPPGEGSEE
ncbi:MAG: hypothetical protein Kow00121_29830 [Elainellaceae cyanobacterium]